MLGWTQNDLAARSGVAKRSIAGLELEASTPKPETMARLVATLAAGGIEFRNADTEVAVVKIRKSPASPSESGSGRKEPKQVEASRSDTIQGSSSTIS